VELCGCWGETVSGIVWVSLEKLFGIVWVLGETVCGIVFVLGETVSGICVRTVTAHTCKDRLTHS
jgi:hypothetical protein